MQIVDPDVKDKAKCLVDIAKYNLNLEEANIFKQST